LITHTPGPWGHREFSVDFLDKVFGEGSVEKTLGYRPENGYVMLTEMALNSVSKAYTVSKKAEDIILRWERLAKYRSKIDFVTNGVDLARWTHPAIAELMAKNETVDSVDFAAAHKNAKRDLISLIKHYKPEIKLSDENMIVSWNRRPANYKRPYFAMDLIEDLGENSNVVFVLAGKAHPKSEKELEFMRRFGETAKRHNNVVYMHDYDIPKAKSILSGSDLVLFTPFSGWEACGTSFMKAGINGVPTLASKDGGAAELIKNGVNGWFFGNDIKECMVIDDGSEAVMQINRADYSEMKSVFFSAMETFYKEPEKYREIMLNTLSSFRENADVAKSLLKYDISPNAVEKYRRIKRAADHTNKEKERSV
jgi:starch phosphorylase